MEAKGMKLHRKPVGNFGKIHDITPENAGWKYVGFNLYRLNRGDTVFGRTGGMEAILIMVEGRARIDSDKARHGEFGDRMNVFEKTPPHAIFFPGESEWSATATTQCVLACCMAPGKRARPAQRIGPNGVEFVDRGKGSNSRTIHNIAMEDRDVADSLLVTEVFTPQGNWSSYPPHRHDEDDYPNITYLEEVYYHRLNPSQGFGVQRIFTEDGSLDTTLSVNDHDVVLVPKGHHPCGAPFGYEMYYLNVMAGPAAQMAVQQSSRSRMVV